MQLCHLALGMAACCAAIPANASTITYNDRATWSSYVTGISTFDSGSQSAGTASQFNSAAGLAITDLQIVGYNITTGTSYELQRVNASVSQTYYQWGSGAILRSGDKTLSNTVYARINFVTAVNAFGFNFGAGGSGGTPGSITVAPEGMATSPITTLPQPNFTFFGATSDSQTFSYVDIYINDAGRYLVLDDISTAAFAPPIQTAEPGTIIQIVAGMGLLALGRRRQTSPTPEE